MVAGFKKPEQAAGSAFPAIAIGCFVAFGGVLFGSVSAFVLTVFKPG